MYVNQVILVGNLTRDVELRTLPSGAAVASFSVATNRSWKEKDSGQKKEEVEFHNVVAFGRTGEVVAQYVHKGDQIFIQGRLHTSSWDNKDTGKKQYKTEIVCETMQFGAKRSADRSYAGSNEPSIGDEPSTQESEVEIDPNEIPF